MKVSIVGVHHMFQVMETYQDRIEPENTVTRFEQNIDDTLINLSMNLKNQGLQPTLIANFSPIPTYMVALNTLEKHGIKVLPDLKDEITYDLTIKTKLREYTFKNDINLELTNFQSDAIEASEYMITNLDTYDNIVYLTQFKKDKIIVYDKLPPYRALHFVEGLLLKKLPPNLHETVSSLMQSGLSWLAIAHKGQILFFTLRNQFRLRFDDVDIFLSEFLKAQKKDLMDWLDVHSINN